MPTRVRGDNDTVSTARNTPMSSAKLEAKVRARAWAAAKYGLKTPTPKKSPRAISSATPKAASKATVSVPNFVEMNEEEPKTPSTKTPSKKNPSRTPRSAPETRASKMAKTPQSLSKSAARSDAKRRAQEFASRLGQRNNVHVETFEMDSLSGSFEDMTMVSGTESDDDGSFEYPQAAASVNKSTGVGLIDIDGLNAAVQSAKAHYLQLKALHEETLLSDAVQSAKGHYLHLKTLLEEAFLDME